MVCSYTINAPLDFGMRPNLSLTKAIEKNQKIHSAEGISTDLDFEIPAGSFIRLVWPVFRIDGGELKL